jgi:hypothetical protein
VDYQRGGEGRSQAKRAVGGIDEAVEVDDMLRVKRSRSRAKRSSSVDGEVVKATSCSGGEAVKGALHRWWRAPGVGGGELCSVSG